MNSLPSFTTWTFAAAGLVLATGPIVIHLLSRRRYQTIDWGAMRLLERSIKRCRRSVKLRDIILLALRTLAILLLGLALAQPYQSAGASLLGLLLLPAVVAAVLFAIAAVVMRGDVIARRRWILATVVALVLAAVTLTMSAGDAEITAAADHDAPVHLLLLIDNSMSMSYQTLTGTLLQDAKQRAEEAIESLPAGSRVSVRPLAGSSSSFSPDPLIRTEAIKELHRIESVDREMDISSLTQQWVNSSSSTSHLTRRILIVTDDQKSNWEFLSDGGESSVIPELHVLDVSREPRSNTWIEDLRVEGDLADTETPTTIVTVLRHTGRSPRENVQVSLEVAGVTAATQTVTLAPGGSGREARFQVTFDSIGGESGQATFVPVTASMTTDRLPADDTRFLAAPVVASLPVVFVDQYGTQPDAAITGRVGESKPLQHLLAPVVQREDPTRQLVTIRHLRIDQLSRDVLQDTRLVVIAGVSSPLETLPLLRQFVEQGGQLVIAAGGEFDPQLWNEADQEPGAKLLPGELPDELVGELPELASGPLMPVRLAYASMQGHPYFQVSGMSDDDLRELYELPFFFRYADLEVTDTISAALARDELRRQRLRSLSGEQNRWITWRDDLNSAAPRSAPDGDEVAVAALPELSLPFRPAVLARFDNEARTPFLVQRQIGRGKVLFVASGFGSNWNTLHTTDAVLMFDRILRNMIQSTLARRNFLVGQQIRLPLHTTDRQVSVRLQRPDDEQVWQPLDIGFMGPDTRGYMIPETFQGGFYSALETAMDSTGGRVGETVYESLIAVNPPASESDLESVSPSRLLADANIHWHTAEETLVLDDGLALGQDWYWMVLIAFVITFLLSELVLLAWPANAGDTRAWNH